ncbi:hypothetical protein ACFORH_43185 [Amycolatopsis roodepoortensis]|uniref:Uncharacterized protein n=1 Tax=Amycolatopsis roodepoortensis TaxID=700274 RepID=A0ABR9LID6_9PSEU|nr:hypothetical protein [Amycolatopsis roodepoortensis]MBE1580454.1 hypothetical protein [Amycolatopsis roodepoortensis]
MSADERWENLLREQINKLARGPRDWVALVELRPRLDERGASRAAQDEHLKRLSKAEKLELAPESNRKALRDPDHDAAIFISGEANHLVMWTG